MIKRSLLSRRGVRDVVKDPRRDGYWNRLANKSLTVIMKDISWLYIQAFIHAFLYCKECKGLRLANRSSIHALL